MPKAGTPARRRRKAFIATPPAFVSFLQSEFPAEFDPDTHRALYALRAVAQLVNDYSNEWLAPFGLTVGKYNYLVQLYGAPEKRLSLNELSRYIHTTNATVTSMINALEREHLVRKIPNDHDRRSVLAEITPRGSRVVTQALRQHHINLERGLADVPKQERQQLMKLLRKVADGFESSFGVASDRVLAGPDHPRLRSRAGLD
jgi:DNA-binding MarR family transcriptional regulator